MTAADCDALINDYTIALLEDSVNPQPTYTLNGKFVDRDKWREGLEKLIEKLMRLKNGIAPYILTHKQTL